MLIGFAGKAGTGKDYVSDYVVKTYGADKRGFSDPLYGMAAKMTGIPTKTDEERRAFKSTYLTMYGRTGRQFLQWLGTDVCRAANPNHWVAMADWRFRHVMAARVVYRDVRFQNEVNWIHNRGGFVVHLTGGQGDEWARGKDHESENALLECADIDLRLHNDMTDGFLETLVTWIKEKRVC